MFICAACRPKKEFASEEVLNQHVKETHAFEPLSEVNHMKGVRPKDDREKEN